MAALVVVVLLALAGGGVFALRRRWKQQRLEHVMSRRLATTYAEAIGLVPEHALRSPPGPKGRVGVSREGLLVSLAPEHGPARLVPWSEIERVDVHHPGAVVVRLAHVGDVMVPSRLGQEIWASRAARP